MRRNRPRVVEAPYRSDEDRLVDRIVMAMLEAPTGVEVTLVLPDDRRFRALMSGVPRPGDGLWLHHPRINSNARRFVVQNVEWWGSLRRPEVEAFLAATPCIDVPYERD